MSKWTLEKILACDEIKTGCWVNKNDQIFNFLFLKKIKNGFKYYSPATDQVFAQTFEECKIFRFFKSCGNEILPPKDKKKIKVEAWVNVYPDGQQAAYSSKWAANSTAFPDRLVCEYLEKEVEVDCE